ncbi:AAA family ATPase [Limisalsivibrio acetivorans]|uniref:AAA family ATPase n=1 Tax=Limisalsivibrio acetivorans TaxID=1304888 RepID=UPI0003B38C31|nr:AAA family ATPase [Limisalsivibrio acetivorans]
MRILEELRPRGFQDIAGQSHLFGDDAVFLKLVESGNFESLIFIGPPGSGKTTTAELIGEFLHLPFFRLHASTSGSSDIKSIIETTKHYGKEAIVFIDELHRFSKTQQDLLLKVIDGKHAKLIGASTENPYHNLTQPLRSRSFVFEFSSLDEKALDELFLKGIDYIKKQYSVNEVLYDEEELARCRQISLGDGRRFLNILELAAVKGRFEGDKLTLGLEGVEDFVTGGTYNTDEHYDLLSAMIKSIRGTDPDAALVWGLKLLDSGVAPEVIFRRLLISASEDIGNAFPDALVFANSAYEAFTSVGRPEGDIIFAHVVTFLASCPKSNRSYAAMHSARDYLAKNNPRVPEILRTSGEGYKYPFDKGEFVRQKYTDEGLQFYKPMESGFEAKISERLRRLWDDWKEY